MMSNMERERRIGAGFDTAISFLIIGNGFDLHHSIATSYSDYHKWLKVHDKQVVKDFDSFVYAVECSDLEDNLGCMRGSAGEDDP